MQDCVEEHPEAGFEAFDRHALVVACELSSLHFQYSDRIDQVTANMLFAAVATDTGWFKYSNTTSATYILAAKLVDAGAKQTLLNEKLYESDTLPRKKLKGLVLEREQVVEEGRVAHSEIRLGDYAATGATPQDTEDLVNLLRLAGVPVAQTRAPQNESIRQADLHHTSDYTPYEGMQLAAWPAITLCRGRAVYLDGALCGEAGHGAFQACEQPLAARVPPPSRIPELLP